MAPLQIGLLEEKHRALLKLCLELEELAADFDSGDIPPTVEDMAKRLEPLVNSSQLLEEETLYPCLEDNADSCFGSLMISQVKSEHRIDRRAAHELALTLRAVADQRCRLSLDTIAHMTRGFQEYLRRHVTAEQMLLESLLVTAAEEEPEPAA